MWCQKINDFVKLWHCCYRAYDAILIADCIISYRCSRLLRSKIRFLRLFSPSRFLLKSNSMQHVRFNTERYTDRADRGFIPPVIESEIRTVHVELRAHPRCVFIAQTYSTSPSSSSLAGCNFVHVRNCAIDRTPRVDTAIGRRKKKCDWILDAASSARCTAPRRQYDVIKRSPAGGRSRKRDEMKKANGCTVRPLLLLAYGI